MPSQSVFSNFAKSDYAKYPFLKGAVKHLEIPDPDIDDLATPEMKNILNRAKERVEQAIFDICVTKRPNEKPDEEIASYPAAIILAAATQDTFIQKRYALAEAKQTEEDLNGEHKKEKIIEFAQNFGWRLALCGEPEKSYEFTLNFVDYLRNTTHLREKKWKLVNRFLVDGKIYLMRTEITRLLSEEVRRHIERRLEAKGLPKLPQIIKEIAEELKNLSNEIRGEMKFGGFPKTVAQAAFPPCIEALYQAFSTGRHLSHVGRFTLTSFLVNIGMPAEDVIQLFKSFSDYNERMTRYQVEHIAGERGSRTQYTPPKCGTLQTHGVCINPDDLCRHIHHPLAYYRRKFDSVK